MVDGHNQGVGMYNRVKGLKIFTSTHVLILAKQRLQK